MPLFSIVPTEETIVNLAGDADLVIGVDTHLDITLRLFATPGTGAVSAPGAGHGRGDTHSCWPGPAPPPGTTGRCERWKERGITG